MISLRNMFNKDSRSNDQRIEDLQATISLLTEQFGIIFKMPPHASKDAKLARIESWITSMQTELFACMADDLTAKKAKLGAS